MLEFGLVTVRSALHAEHAVEQVEVEHPARTTVRRLRMCLGVRVRMGPVVERRGVQVVPKVVEVEE